MTILPGVSFFTVGSLLAVRRAQNAVSWLCLVIGLIWLVIAATGAASQWAFFEGLTGLAEWLGVLGALWVPALGLMATHLPLRLPDGLLLSPRWRWFSRFCTLAIVLVTLGIGTAPGPVNGIAGTRNPVASEQLQVLEPAFALLLIAFLGAMAALVIRYRRSGGTQRLQLRVIAFGGLSFFLVFIVSLASLVGLVPEGSGLEQSLQSLASLFYNAIPIAIAVAVFRYRLYDIDLVINKTLVFIVLAGFITAVYAGIVVGLGRLLPIGENDLGLAIAATALVAVAFEPVRVRVQHWANRLVYGTRATPYEVLAAMTARIGSRQILMRCWVRLPCCWRRGPVRGRRWSGLPRRAGWLRVPRPGIPGPVRPRWGWSVPGCRTCRVPIWFSRCATRGSWSVRCR